ncbi:MAG TPA: hypothetical protein DHV59_11405 [Oxalobacteraceae bacterium]|nr:hypothetical protein [Oxalobacteraceae bacterium]
MDNKNDHMDLAPEILIIEDSETQADQLAHLLSRNGFRVRVAKDGLSGLDMARAVKPTLIVSDIAMPRMDGFEMCRQLKKDSFLQDVPVILLTALSSLYDVIKGLDCGADNFIRKPFEEKYLLGRIRYILANRELRSNERVQLGMQINLGGQTHFVTAERQQIFDLLISTYEEAIQMTEELRTQQRQIARSYQAIEGMYQIAAALNPAITESEVSEKALERALELPGVTGGCIKLLDDDNNFRTVAVQGFEAPDALPDACTNCNSHKKIQGGSLRTPVVIDNCATHGQGGFAGSTAGNHVSVPLTAGQRTIGVLNLSGDAETMSRDEDFHVLETVGNQIAVALERAHLYANMERLVNERTAALQSERNRSSAIVNTTGALVLLFDLEGRIAAFNPACEKTSGWKFEEVRGRYCWDVLLSLQHVDAAKAALEEMLAGRLPELFQREWEWVARDGSLRKIIWSPTFLRKPDQSIEYLVATGIDVTELRLAEEKVQYLSNFDTLTGLPNRILLKDGLTLLQEKAAAGKEIIGFLMVEFARLPRIRESLGPQAGQELLLQVANRLRKWDKEAGSGIGRLGDSSFAVVVLAEHSTELVTVTRQLLALLDQPFTCEQQDLHLEACIGIAVSPDDGRDFDTLSQCAEVALRGALADKTARYEFYTPELNHGAHERFRLESALRRALDQNQLVLHYQPQVDLRSGRIVGVEALIRWQHPELGMIPPGSFIGLAEETGMIVPIGAWVLRTACSQAKEWQRAGLRELRVGVNLSARQFGQQEMVSLISRTLDETGLAAEFLDIELTESLVMADVEQAIGILNDLRALGVQLSIDDFGTGYSSLSYLKRFPIDVLKIDQSFVREITQHANDAAISDAIISMAHSLGIKVIAEGVETEEQCAYLSRNMCDEVQGYLFSKPLPAMEIEAMLREERCLPEHLLRLHKPQRSLLLVDDEPNILSALKRLVRRDDYRIFTADSGAEGLALLAQHEIDVIVSDQRMPGMTGVDFLRTVKDLYPQTVRIVLSGFTELQSVTDAVNEGAIYKFLTKPWDDEQLRKHIAQAFEHKEMADENRRLGLEVRAANHELAKANRQLEELLQQKQQQIQNREVSLDIVHEALQHVPQPVIGLDDDDLVVFVNLSAQALFKDAGPILGIEADQVMPELWGAIQGAVTGKECVVQLGSSRFDVVARRMGHGTKSRGKLITLTRHEEAIHDRSE